MYFRGVISKKKMVGTKKGGKRRKKVEEGSPWQSQGRYLSLGGKNDSGMSGDFGQ